MLTPDAGRGTCLGHDLLTQQAAIKRHAGYMTQRFSYYEDLEAAFISLMDTAPDNFS